MFNAIQFYLHSRNLNSHLKMLYMQNPKNQMTKGDSGKENFLHFAVNP